jgi:ferritin-like metal-binding protein YciE
MQLETLQDLYVHELKDLYSAEKQLIRALAQDGQSRQERQTSDRL